MFQDLMQRAKGGEASAIEELLLPFLPALNAFVRSRMSKGIMRRESSEDVVQSVCREVIGDLHSVRAEDQEGFRSWLFGVVHNKLRSKESFHRAAKRDVGNELRGTLGGADPEEVLLAYGAAATPSQDAAAQEEIARIEAAFEHLSDDHSDVLRLVAIAGLTYSEAGRVLGRSEDAVRQLVHRARAKLATLLD